MAILLPSGYSTFGDATRTEGPGPHRKYVLAQYRSDAELAWVGKLRAALSTNEVKFGLFREHRARLRKDASLWQQVQNGVGQATIVVIDPTPFDDQIRRALAASGAEPGLDYGDRDVAQRSAAAIVGGTPIAWLPQELTRVVGDDFRTLADFAPAAIQDRIGPTLRAATVFAARVHATFDVATLSESLRATTDVYRSPLAPVILRELLSVERAFDEEAPATVHLLNDASDQIAEALSASLPGGWQAESLPLVREVGSSGLEQIQAADMAAGWAREIVDSSGIRALGDCFERVWLNGELMKGSVLRTV